MTGMFEEETPAQFSAADLFRQPTDQGVITPEKENQLQTLKDLLQKSETLKKSKPANYDSLDTLQDVGYEEPTQEQLNAPGRKAAAKFIAAKGMGTDDPTKMAKNMVGRGPAAALGAYGEEEEELTLDNADDAPAQSSLQEKVSLLEQYKKLTENKQKTNSNLDMLMGGNQIAQAIASGYGGKIGDGSEAVNQLKKSSEAPVADLLGQGKAVDTQSDIEMADPASDISKFARERAIANATKMGLAAEDLKRLENMSAKQLEKLGLFKADAAANQASKLGLYYTTIRDDKTGQDRVVGINRQTGEIVNDIGGKTYADKIIENKQTGQTEVYKQGAGVNTLDKSNTQTPEEAAKKQEETKTEYSSPTALNKVNPKLYKKFNDLQSDFSKDMKDSREVATSVTNLAAKLQPGQSMKIDSGLLGGIQTQAAKMAGQKGVLTDQDLVKFAGAGGVSAAIDRFFSGNFDGEMSEQDVNFFKAFAKKMESSLAEDINNRSKLYSGQILNESKDYLPGLTEQDVNQWLNVQQVAPVVQQKAASGKVTIQDSNGKTHVIDADKLEAAKKRDSGLKVIEGK